MPQNEMPLGTVLVADDDEEIRKPMEYVLRLQGYRVLTADDGVQALSVLEEQPVDVALLDASMPRESGFSVCRAVKSRSATRLVPIVLMAGSGGGTDIRIRGVEAGADDFLNKPVRKEELLARVKSLVRLKRMGDELETAESVLFNLASSIEARDPYTAGHCQRVARYAADLGEQLGLSDELCMALRRGGLVHDIGKVVVPDQVLLKRGPLNAEERRLVESHAATGEQLCAPLKSFRSVLPMIRSHHERLDGSGYPDHLSGDQIPLGARILQIVDVYDALTSDRPYRLALTPEQALATLREEAARGWWDKRLVGELESLLRSAPDVSISELAS